MLTKRWAEPVDDPFHTFDEWHSMNGIRTRTRRPMPISDAETRLRQGDVAKIATIEARRPADAATSAGPQGLAS